MVQVFIDFVKYMSQISKNRGVDKSIALFDFLDNDTISVDKKDNFIIRLTQIIYSFAQIEIVPKFQ